MSSLFGLLVTWQTWKRSLRSWKADKLQKAASVGSLRQTRSFYSGPANWIQSEPDIPDLGTHQIRCTTDCHWVWQAQPFLFSPAFRRLHMLRFFKEPSLKLCECCKSLQLLDSWVLVGMVSPHLPEHTRQWKCHNMLAILQDASIISIFVYLQFILVDTLTHSVVSLCIRTVWVSVHEFKSGELPRVELLGLGLKDSFWQLHAVCEILIC